MTLAARLEQFLPHYTYEDYSVWEGKWELISGIPYAMTPSPSIAHQSISQRIANQLGSRLQDCHECQALLPVDWKISDNTVVQPDNLIVCYKPQGLYLDKAPTLIFEIVSKSSELRDTELKFQIYQQEGVKYYCIVFPGEEIAKVYQWNQGVYVKKGDFREEKVEFDLTEDCLINFDFSEIWLKKTL